MCHLDTQNVVAQTPVRLEVQTQGIRRDGSSHGRSGVQLAEECVLAMVCGRACEPLDFDARPYRHNALLRLKIHL
jgi:hypothetical protein